ncbi:phage major capsid protein [Paenibacillus alba]|nr:phage major capsid protein [Paenibacillus alba]NQX67975.1 phage major capsid protein [Paenibacillus alba]
MTDKEKELRQLLETKRNEARSLVEAGKTDEARTIIKEAEALTTQIETLRSIEGLIVPGAAPNVIPPVIVPNQQRNDEEFNLEHRDSFIQLMRGRDLTSQQRSILEEKRAMTSSSGEDGGFLIPQDIQTMINTVKRQFVALSDYVSYIPVTTNAGSRVLEKFADITPLAKISAENTELADLDNPKVRQVPFTIQDYGGIMTLTNNLLADSPENIMSFISQWIGRKEIITDNSLILAIMKTFSKKAISGLDGIKQVLNVELDPMVAMNAIIVTNQDGYNYLDTLKDGQGRYILQPDPTQPNRKLFDSKPVVVMANRLLPTATKKAPIIIGDLQSSVALFDRQQLSILTTNIGGKAFETNTTKSRVIDREDVVKWDDEAMVYGEITIA